MSSRVVSTASSRSLPTVHPLAPRPRPASLAPLFPPGTPADALDLLSKMVALDPRERVSCEEALRHPYFSRGEPASSPGRLPKPPGRGANPLLGGGGGGGGLGGGGGGGGGAGGGGAAAATAAAAAAGAATTAAKTTEAATAKATTRSRLPSETGMTGPVRKLDLDGGGGASAAAAAAGSKRLREDDEEGAGGGAGEEGDATVAAATRRLEDALDEARG